MKLRLICFLVVAILWPSSGSLLAQNSPKPSSPAKTKEELLVDVRHTQDGGVSARAAIHAAIEKKEVDVVIAGLTGPNYDIRWEGLMALKTFSATQRKEALLVALRNAPLWKKILGGDLASAQYVYFGDFAAALKEFGIDATRDELSDAAARNRITQKLAGFFVPAGR